MSPVILSGIKKTLDGYSSSELDTNAKDAKTFAFQAIGLLAKRMPHLFRHEVDMAARLFDALKLEAPSLRFTIQEATVSLAAAYKVRKVSPLRTWINPLTCALGYSDSKRKELKDVCSKEEIPPFWF
ncbi:hypothetical protein BT93_H2397 [Corymbia citriodora subsp. variegata]|nr:hypothetical protein BT93_H2397 [Corymbia citriodora subsp. variegata]